MSGAKKHEKRPKASGPDEPLKVESVCEIRQLDGGCCFGFWSRGGFRSVQTGGHRSLSYYDN